MRRYNYPAEPASEISVPTGKHRRWLARAVAATRYSRHHTPMAALAVQGGRHLAHGVNIAKNSPALTRWEMCSRHAERSLLDTASSLEGATVYVARVRRDGTEALARPCRHCRELLTHAGVRQVVFTIAPGLLGIDRLR